MKKFKEISEANKMKGKDPCWSGYEMVGMKDKAGKKVPNCVPTKEEVETVVEAKDKGEYDQEGDMAMTQLRSIIYHAEELHDMLGKDDNLPEWVQSKLTLAQDYMQTVCDYMYTQKNVKEEIQNDICAKCMQDPCVCGGNHVQVTEQHAEKGRFRPTIPYKVPVSHVASPRMRKPDEMKESKDDTPPFDGPYTKAKGTVTDKSGAKHTDMSRARTLARQAMQKQMKTPKKLGEEASRKADIVKTAAKKKKTDSKADTFQAEPEISSTITKNY